MTGDMAVGIATSLAIGFAVGSIITADLETKDYANMKKLQAEVQPKCPRVQVDVKLWNRAENRWEHWCVHGKEEAEKRGKRMTY